MDMTDVMVAKRGETVLQMAIRRGPKGLRIKVKAHALVEELMRSWAPRLDNGEVEEVSPSDYGRYWKGLEGNLTAYRPAEGTGVFTFRDGLYTLNALGQPIKDNQGVLNLSFLRLKGISEGTGVTFYISGIYSDAEARKIKDLIEAAAGKFYSDYLLPVEMELTIMTQEIRV